MKKMLLMGLIASGFVINAYADESDISFNSDVEILLYCGNNKIAKVDSGATEKIINVKCQGTNIRENAKVTLKLPRSLRSPLQLTDIEIMNTRKIGIVALREEQTINGKKAKFAIYYVTSGQGDTGKGFISYFDKNWNKIRDFVEEELR